MSVSEFGAVMDSIHPPGPGHFDDAAGKGKEREQDAARGVEPHPSSPRFGGAGAGASPTTLDFRVEDQPVPGLRQEEEQEEDQAGDDADHHHRHHHVETFDPANDPFLRMPEDESDGDAGEGEEEEEAEEGFFHHHHEEEEEEAAGAAGRPGNEEGTDAGHHLHGGDLDEVDL
jgi:hypothetical protein